MATILKTRIASEDDSLPPSRFEANSAIVPLNLMRTDHYPLLVMITFSNETYMPHKVSTRVTTSWTHA